MNIEEKFVCSTMLHKVEPVLLFTTFFFQLATLKFFARQVKQTVVTRATTCSTCNAVVLRDKLNKNVARTIGPLCLKMMKQCFSINSLNCTFGLKS